MAEKCSFFIFLGRKAIQVWHKILKSENHWYDICNDCKYKVWSLKGKYGVKALAYLKPKAA